MHLYIQFGSQDIRRYAEAKGYLEVFAAGRAPSSSIPRAARASRPARACPFAQTRSPCRPSTAISRAAAAPARSTSRARSSWQPRRLPAESSIRASCPSPPEGERAPFEHGGPLTVATRQTLTRLLRLETSVAKTRSQHALRGTQVGPDTLVTLAYTLYDEEGDVLDSTDEEEPLSYLHGYGQIVPGLERAIEGMVQGNERSVIVSPEDGYGEYDPEAVLEIERADFPNEGEVFVSETSSSPIRTTARRCR